MRWKFRLVPKRCKNATRLTSTESPAISQSHQHLVSIISAAGAAVVTCQGRGVVPFFTIDVILENGATNMDIVRDLDQLRIIHSKFSRPEGHDLHQAYSAGT